MKLKRTIWLLLFVSSISTNALSDISYGLVAFYPFDGNANDYSGNQLNGVANNVLLKPDRFGNPNGAYEFNGHSSYIEIDDNALLDFTNQFSISLWINQYSAQYYGGRLIDKGTSGVGDGYILDTYDQDTGRKMRVPSFVDNFQNSNTAWPLNEWHHLVMVFDNGQFYFYLNGEYDGIGTYGQPAVPVNDLNLFIGKPHIGCNETCGFREFFHGRIDDVRLYDRVLTEPEIYSLWTEPSNCEAINRVLVSYTSTLESHPNYRISGTMTVNGNPACGLALSNGSHMFTCDSDAFGKFDLTCPVDANGTVTIFGFVDNAIPFRDTFTP